MGVKTANALPSSPFVNVVNSGGPVTMSSFLKSNPPNGIPMMRKHFGPTQGDHGTNSPVRRNPSAAMMVASPRRSIRRNSITAPQVTIVDGKIMVDTDSLVVTRQSCNDLSSFEHVEETGRRISSSSFRKKSSNDRWNNYDTQLFFEGLNVFGTDFGMISEFIPNRTREQIKRKFKKEERDDPKRIATHLNTRKSLADSLLQKNQP